MKKRSKRLLALILAAILLSFSACGESKNSDAGNETTETPKPSDVQLSEAEGEGEDETELEPEYLEKYAGTDFGGETYTFSVHYEDVYPNYSGDEESGEPVNDAQYRRDTWIEENCNIDLTYIKGEDVLKKVQSLVMSDDKSIDCIEDDMANIHTALTKNGLLRNLKSVEGLELDAPWWSQRMNNEFTMFDKLYATTGPIVFAYYYSPRLVAFNQRLAIDFGLESPYSIVEEGKWTLDYMKKSMETVKMDLDGDGMYGDEDMWGASVDEYSAAGFYISAGGTQISFNADGKPYFTFNDERNYSIIEKVASIIGNEEYTQKAERVASRSGVYDIRDKVYTFKGGHALYLGYGSQAISIYLRDMEDDYGILPVPKLDEVQSDYITFGSAYSPSYIGLPISNNRENINGVLLNMMGYISQRDVQPLVSDVLLKGKAARDKESQTMIDLIYSDVCLDLNSCYNFGGSFNLLRDITMGNKQDFTSNWKRVEKMATKEMEKLFANIEATEDTNP